MKFDIFRDAWILLALWILITLGCSRSVDAAGKPLSMLV